MNTTPKPLRYTDGWYTDDPKEFRFYTRDSKTWSYWGQVSIDARSWKVWALWLFGLVWPAAGIWLGSPQLVMAGIVTTAYVIYKYIHMLRRVVRGHRDAELVEGTVTKFDARHPLFRNFVAGELKRKNDGATKKRIMALLPEWVVKTYARPDGSMEVLVSHSPEADFSHVVGFKQP